MSDMRVTFWGVRGSIPVPGPSTVKYGGNTSCLEINTDDGDRIIFDAGTGLRVLGESLDLSKKQQLVIMISHPHWDHINGIPFFTPIYIPGNVVHFYGPSTHESSIEDVVSGQMKYTYFPVRTAELLATVKFHDLKEETFQLNNCTIQTFKLNHPVDCLGYKVIYEGKTFIYLGDNEPYYNVYGDDDTEIDQIVADMNRRLLEFVSGADLLVADSQYTPAEYPLKKGWGHSTVHHVLNMAIRAGVKKLFLFHHEPLRTDQELDFIVEHYREKIAQKGLGLELFAAMEGKTFTV